MGAILNKVETKQARLLVLSTSFSGGGAEKIARLMVEKLEGSTCILFENEAGIQIDGSDVCVMWGRRFTNTIATLLLNGFRLLYIQIKKLRLHPDTTISHLEGPNFLNLLTVGGGKKVIVVHNVIAVNYAEKSFLDSCKLVLINRLYKRADVVVGVSRDVCNELVQNCEVDEDRVVFVPNAVDISAIDKASMSSFFDNRDRVLADSYVINVASLTLQKNQFFLLRVFKEFRKWSRNHNGLKLVVIGDGEQKQALIEYCREIDLEAQEIEDGHYTSSSKVLFLGYQENPYPFMRNAKVLLLTSLWEGLPLVLLESMALGIPVVSGNVSLYNETKGVAIWPTPVVGALGVIDDAGKQCTIAFKNNGDLVLLLGADEVSGASQSIAGSAYLEVVHGKVAGIPRVDIDLELRLQLLCRMAVGEGLLHSAHDCADGGLAVTLAESCFAGGIGFVGNFTVDGRWDAALFGEAQSRIVVSLAAVDLDNFATLASEQNVPWVMLGDVGGNVFSLPALMNVDLVELESAWKDGLEKMLD